MPAASLRYVADAKLFFEWQVLGSQTTPAHRPGKRYGILYRSMFTLIYRWANDKSSRESPLPNPKHLEKNIYIIFLGHQICHHVLPFIINANGNT